MKAENIEIMSRGVCIKSNRLLLCHTNGSDNTYLPGGHIDFQEPARAALVREIREELDLDSTAGRFLGGVEHTFIQKGERHCEVNLVFEVDIPAADPSVNPASSEDYIEFLWLDLDAIKESDLEPASLKDSLVSWLNFSGEIERWSSTYA